MLKFDYPSVRGLNIRNVAFTVPGMTDPLLPITRKMVFPRAMPFGFVFPPRITSATPLVGPVPNLQFSALCDHRLIASWAIAGQIGLRLLALPINERELHVRVVYLYRFSTEGNLGDGKRVILISGPACPEIIEKKTAPGRPKAHYADQGSNTIFPPSPPLSMRV